MVGLPTVQAAWLCYDGPMMVVSRRLVLTFPRGINVLKIMDLPARCPEDDPHIRTHILSELLEDRDRRLSQVPAPLV